MTDPVKIQTPINFDLLREPLDPKFIDWRIQSSGMSNGKPWGKALAYVDARGVQTRLDQVCGPDRWRVSYLHIPGGVMCELSILCGDGWVTKSDGAPETSIEAFKGGISKALVRAASTWGIGRYLYDLPEGWAKFVTKGTTGSKDAKIDGGFYSWLPPELPAWALPKGFVAVRGSVKDLGPMTEPMSLPREPNVVIQPLKPATEAFKGKIVAKDDFGGGYTMNFSRHKGKTLAEIGPKDVENFGNWLLKTERETGKAQSNNAQDFLDAARLYLKEFRMELK